jgi:hypothetical protein
MKRLLISGALVLAGLASESPASAEDFNSYVLKAIDALYPRYSGGGYNLSSAFTHNLPYGTGVIKKSSTHADAAPTMCVAGVTEVILTAIKLYADEKGFRDETAANSPFRKAPLSLWTKGNLSSIRANMFMFAGTGSRGTAHTLQRFGMGRELPFDQLKPGDFINLNRVSGSGHAVVFLGYLDGNGTILDRFGPEVKGFKYFSAQGKGKPDAGLAYRYAYFEGTCPPTTAQKVHDCHVIRSRNPALLNSGRMNTPDGWAVDASLAALRQQIGRDIEMSNPGVTRAFVDAELDRELPSSIDPKLDGVEGD